MSRSASARKKRASNRLGDTWRGDRAGDKVQGVEISQGAKAEELAPWANARARRGGLGEKQPNLLECLTDSGQSQSPGAPDRPGLFQSAGDVWPKFGGARRSKVAGIDPSARKHPFVGHKVMSAVPPAHQHAWLEPVTTNENQGRGVPGSHGARCPRPWRRLASPQIVKRLFVHRTTLGRGAYAKEACRGVTLASDG